MTADNASHKAAYDDLNIRSILLVGGVGSILVFVAIISVQVIYFRYQDREYDRKVLTAPETAAETIISGQMKRLAVAGDGAEAGERSIAIQDAMNAVVAEYEARQATAETRSEN